MLLRKIINFLKIVVPVVLICLFILFLKNPPISSFNQDKAINASEELNSLMEKMTPQIMQYKQEVEQELSKGVEIAQPEPDLVPIALSIEEPIAINPQYKYELNSNQLHLIKGKNLSRTYVVWDYNKLALGTEVPIYNESRNGFKSNETEKYNFINQVFSYGSILKDSAFGKHAQYNASRAATIVVVFQKVLDSKEYFRIPGVRLFTLYQRKTLAIFIDSKTKNIIGHGWYVDPALSENVKVESDSNLGLNMKRLLENQHLIKWLDQQCKR